jgi:hypothetical protein
MEVLLIHVGEHDRTTAVSRSSTFIDYNFAPLSRAKFWMNAKANFGLKKAMHNLSD